MSNGEIAPFSSRHQLEPLVAVIRLGIALIDEQHKEIADNICRILQAFSFKERLLPHIESQDASLVAQLKSAGITA